MNKSKAKANLNRNRKPTRKAKRKPLSNPALTAAPNAECKYRVGTLYSTLFIEANKVAHPAHFAGWNKQRIVRVRRQWNSNVPY